MLQRAKRKRFNIRPPAWYRSDGYRAWVRGFPCTVAGIAGHACVGKSVCAHVRFGTDGCGSEKPSDWHCLPLCDDDMCRGAHSEQHRMGEPSFWAKYGKDPHKVTAEFWWHPKNSHRLKFDLDPDKTTAQPPARPGTREQHPPSEPAPRTSIILRGRHD